jgi:predicted NUDIX family phosphoesterase
MSLVAEERILVVPTSLFKSLGYFQGFSRETSRYWPRIVEGDHVEYRARGEMEADPSFKQLIPYCLFRWTDANGDAHLFEYQRGGGSGEARLRAKRSVGIGGHISSIDAEVGPTHDVYREGMRRELEEEVIIDTPYKETVVGLINDDETPVGQVHLGMVHLCDVEQPNVRPREADILGARFSPVADILTRLEQFESWSEIAVRALFS